ncbi:hypothetical protein [Kocuria sp. CPCC 205263]|uniref:hypothetical protein n=1 Tax=Kocuria sp. CPCC 205263 TaxID=3073555 RepID=UPI0034D5358F
MTISLLPRTVQLSRRTLGETAAIRAEAFSTSEAGPCAVAAPEDSYCPYCAGPETD